MSVIVKDLTKIYGAQKAIDQLNFETKKGEIIGFLGPNGAGKTTTMKILTAYMPSTSGTAEVCGHNVETESQEVRRLIGYLPEHNPLYKEMYVKEYLSFVADIMGLSDKKARIADMIEKTGLGHEQHKLISSLSKGYRQRVGLAQALIHDPEVLILDEPTSGLDPNQLAEIRMLIREFGKEKTVIFSSHIMQEVQALCDRVIILNKGKIIADDPIQNLQYRVSGQRVIHLHFDSEIDVSALAKIEGVSKVNTTNKKEVQIIVESEEDLRPVVFKEIVKQGWVLIEMRQEKISVENIFQELTVDA
jgi:ABC-2 type transport system ATP-binding protein